MQGVSPGLLTKQSKCNNPYIRIIDDAIFQWKFHIDEDAKIKRSDVLYTFDKIKEKMNEVDIV